MKARIFSHDTCIGTSQLKVGDASMGVLQGTFTPTAEYSSNIQKQVWKIWNSETDYTANWKELNLNAQLENGYFLFPLGGITIDDIEEVSDELPQINIIGIHNLVITDFIVTEPPRPFTEEPWEELSIKQKLAFESELTREVGQKKSLTNMLFRKEQHILSKAQISALCYSEGSDTVLFEIHDPNLNESYAVVHLTWTGKPESGNYPKTELYLDYDHFKNQRMYPDKAEWEE